MRMTMMKIAAGWIAYAALAASPLTAQKIGLVDFQQALLDTADMQKQAAALEAKFQPRQAELEQLTNELQDIQTKLQSAQGEAAAQLQQEGLRKQREAQRMSEDLQADVDFERDAILQEAAARMRDVLAQLRQTRKLDLILDTSSALAHNPALVITKEATAAYNAKHPAK